MTKIEQKLIELGYVKITPKNNSFQIWHKVGLHELMIKLIDGKVADKEVIPYPNFTVRLQVNIDNLQQAYNQLESDLEVLTDGTKE